MSSLIKFLRARLDEDQAVAIVASPGPWSVDNTTYPEAIYDADQATVISGGRWGGEASIFSLDEDAFHIARHDPSRVLAEVQAKRAILDELERLGHLPLSLPEDLQYVGAHQALLGAARWLALPYQDHPDYREEWRP